MTQTATLPEPMETTLRELLKQPPEIRVEIGERLIASVPPVIDDASMVEYQRRAQELEDGSVQGIPAHEAVERARRRLDEARRDASGG